MSSFASNLRDHNSQSVASAAIKLEQAIAQMDDMYASIKPMIHHQMGVPYPTSSPTLVTIAGETPNLIALCHKDTYAIPQRRPGEESIGESCNQRAPRKWGNHD